LANSGLTNPVRLIFLFILYGIETAKLLQTFGIPASFTFFISLLRHFYNIFSRKQAAFSKIMRIFAAAKRKIHN
jgi:hypothetical protein